MSDWPPAIRLRGLHKAYGGQPVLDGLDLDIAAGELLVVLGPSGSGKSTLLRIVAGLEEPDRGEVLLHGTPASHLPARKRGLGVVFQEHALFQHMSVEQNIAFGLRVRGAPEAEVRRTVNEMLDLVALQHHRRRLPRQLSGGQRQRVALARALACRPQALLFDEPFAALDARTRSELRREVRSLLRSHHVAALFITHDQEEALEVGDRIALLNAGRIEQIGTPFEIYNQPRTEFVAAFLGAANILFGRWQGDHVAVGSHRLPMPPDPPPLVHGQPVNVVFRPEDAVLNFQLQLLDTPYPLGPGTVESVSYVGPVERLTIRLALWPPPGTLPVLVTRSKWDATEMQLGPEDPVVVGLKIYRLLPFYPLGGKSGAKLLTI